MKKAFLFLLGLIAFIGVQAQTSPYEGAALADGNFFLYNVESGLWLQNNDGINRGDWNTRGAVGSYGLEFAISAIDGGYKLDPKFGHNHSMNASNFYLDTGDGVTAWTITPVNLAGVTNAYGIKFGDQELGIGEDGKLALGATSNTVWQFVTREERIAYIQEQGSVDNPVDATFLINDPGFSQENERASSWVWAREGGNLDDIRVDDGNEGYRCRRSYAVWNTKNFTLKQTISGAPNGKYKMTIKGYYRDGNRDDVAARRAAGEEKLLANYFVNDSKAKVMSILDGAAKTRSDGKFYYPEGDTPAPYGYYPDNAAAFNRIFQDNPDAYTNEGVIGIVSDGNLLIGVEKIDANASDWFAFDDFRISYLGNEIDLSEFVAALEEAIASAEAFNSSKTSTALKNALDEALQTAQAALTSTSQEEITEATSALNAALSAAKSVDVSVLKATAELAKAEGVNTDVADELIENATEAGPVADALFDLRAARKVKAQAMPDVYTGSEPAEGKVYIYNIGTGLFLGTGSSYNTHCAVDQVGIEVELIASGNGFKIKTNRGGGWLAKGNEASENASVYVDSWNGDQVWQFLPVDGQEGVYNISFDGTTNDLLGYNPHTLNDNNTGKFWGSIGKMRSDVSDPMNQWKIVTAEERESLIAAASKDNPVDVSYLIKSPSMNAQDSRDADWTREVNGGNGGAWVNNTENHGYEVWNADDFKIHQTIEGLAPGLYEVSVSGFWREGDGGNQANIVNNGGALQQKAYLYANDAQALLANIASCPDFVPGIATQASNKGFFPNWPGEGLEFFETGAFKTTINVVVEEDGELTIGVGVDEKVAYGDWVVMDNFRLTYLGEATDNDRALASIESGKNYSIFTEIDGEKYYVTEDGHLTTSAADRGAFEFEKVTGGDYVEYGFKMKNGPWRFTNPPLVNNVANLTPGSFSRTTGNDRSSWEAQVFFKEGDLYAIRSCNVHDETSSWNDAGRTYWTYSVEEAPTPEYTYERVYLWQLEENTIVDVAYNLVYEEKVVKTEDVSIATGKAPVVPQSFYTEMADEFNGLVFFTPDAEEITEETTEVNFVAESAISESFERAKWFNMNIRGSYWVTMDETEPYYPTVDKDLESEASLWAFGAVEGEPNQIVIWNRAAGPDMSLLNTGESDANGKPLVAMREGQTAWDFAPNSDGFVIHQVGTGENEWVNQNGGASGPFSIWNSAYAKGDGGSVLRIFFVEETEPIDPYDAALAEIKDGHHYRVFTEVDGEKYYVTAGGTLSTDAEEAPSFLFEKTQTSGGSYEYGFKLNNNGTFFSNPPSPNEASLNSGHINTNGSGRETWEAQVFFLNADGLYAVRSTNAPDGGEGSWEWIGSAYWTVNEGPVAEYQWEPNYVWQLEEDMSYKELALNLVYNGEVVETQPATYQVGDTPAIPTAFYTKMADELFGLVTFSSDVDEVTEETTEVNFTAKSILSESFEGAKWFNMHIRGLDANAPYWVNKDETEPYYPRGDKDLTAPESQWAFTSADGEPNHIIIWNRADDSAMTLTDADGNVVMREGDFVWEIFPNNTGFVMRPLGGDENHWVNQNGGNSGPLQFWNSVNGKGDDGSTFRVVPVETDNLELAIDVERYVGQGYTPTIAEVDFTEALEYLGAEAVTEDMLYFVNPDGTEMDYATYKVSPTPEFTYDGWCDAEGAAAQWNSTTNMINVKFFEAIPDGQFSICDMNGADEVGKTYTVKWALKANDKAVVYAVNVTFVDAPELTYTFDELDKVATEDLNIKSEIGDAYEGLNATVDIDAILAALEVESLGDVIIAAVQPDGTLDTNYMLGGTDGWRDADGTWKSWSDNLETAPYFYVKANFEATPQIYEAGGYPGHTDEAATFTAPFVFVKNGTNQAYVLNVNLVYGESGAVAYDGTVDVTAKIQGQVVAEAPTADETITIIPNEDGTVNINFASLTLAAPGKPVNDFIVENVVVTENEDGSVSYSLEGATVSLTAASGMIMTYNATLTGTQAEGEGPEITLILAQPSGLQNEIVFHPNALVPEAEEFDGMIKQILSHPQTGVQGQATGDQKVTIAATGDGKADITYSGFTMPVTGAEIPEFTVEGVIVTENEDGTISYALPEDAEAEVIIDRGTGVVKYAVTLEGTQESADATPVLKLTLENSVVDTVWFGADEKTIDKAIATSIRGINALGTEGNIYDLSGRKVEKIQRGGIYIVNGKKVSVK